MPRIGIDLSSTRCHLIEVRSTAGRVFRRSPSAAPNIQATQVTSFETIPSGWSDPASLVPALRRWLSTHNGDRRAWVTVWGSASVHQLMVLPADKPADLARLAREEAVRDIELVQQTEVVSGIMVGASRIAAHGPAKREVMFIAASEPEIRGRIQPLAEAGFVIDGVTTPPLALCSVARLRRDIAPGMTVVLLAVGQDLTALAIVRDGMLLFAREMPWGYESAGGRVMDRDQFAVKLAGEVRRSILFFRQSNRADVTQVLLCGDRAELRSLTAPMIADLDIEVETMDSLDGIAADRLPRPGDLFRDQVAALRLAWAMAADAVKPLNLVPPEAVIRRETERHAAILTGGLAAALALGGLGYLVADRSVRANELKVRELEQQVSVLEPRAQQAERARQDIALADVRRAALGAFDSQAPRLTRALEALAQLAPPEITFRRLTLTAAGASWLATLSGTAISPDPARAQAVVNDFLRALQGSSYLGLPAAPAALRMISGVNAGTAAGSASVRVSIPPGKSGSIEFSVTFEIHK